MNRRFFLTLLGAYAVRTSAGTGADEDADEDKSGLSGRP